MIYGIKVRLIHDIGQTALNQPLNHGFKPLEGCEVEIIFPFVGKYYHLLT